MARPSLKSHPKFRRLVHVLRCPVPHALGYLECLWGTSYETGNDRIGDAVDVELAAEWPAAPDSAGVLCKALAQCGFLDERDGVYYVHDLMDHAPHYVKDRLRKELERRSMGVAARTTNGHGVMDAAQAPSGAVRIRPGSSRTRRGKAAEVRGQVRESLSVLHQPNPTQPNPNPPTPAAARGGGGARADLAAALEGFELFWSAYPRKADKQASRRAWAKLAPDAELRSVILAAVHAFRGTEQWQREGGRFVPYPATFINGRRWEDEPPEAAAAAEPSGPSDADPFRRVRTTKADADRLLAGMTQQPGEGHAGD